MKKLIVLDANILIRAILGKQVPALLQRYDKQVRFYTPRYCYSEVHRHLPRIFEQRKLPPESFVEALTALESVVLPLDEAIYGFYEEEAKRRLRDVDLADWPLIALALTLNCPIWTEDRDFFGTGVATWRSRNVEIYLAE